MAVPVPAADPSPSARQFPIVMFPDVTAGDLAASGIPTPPAGGPAIDLSRPPLYFESNDGKAGPNYLYVAREPGYSLALGAGQFNFTAK